MRVKKLNVSEEGLNRFFGPLEARIMNIIWSSGTASIKKVREMLCEDQPISFNAVMTVLNRLLEKGHLKKTTKGKGRTRTSSYEAVQTKEQFLSEQTREVTYGLVHEYGDLVVNHMIDVLGDVDPELLDRLEMKLLAVRRRTNP